MTQTAGSARRTIRASKCRRGEWIALLNNDAEAQPDWLRTMYDAVSDRSEYGMVACKILVYEDHRKIDKAGHLIYLDGQNRGRGSGQIDHGQFDRCRGRAWPDGCAAMYRASMLRTIGGFDEDLFAYGDDAELGMRARIAGWKCLYVPKAVVFHRRGSTLGLFSEPASRTDRTQSHSAGCEAFSRESARVKRSLLGNQSGSRVMGVGAGARRSRQVSRSGGKVPNGSGAFSGRYAGFGDGACRLPKTARNAGNPEVVTERSSSTSAR